MAEIRIRPPVHPVQRVELGAHMFRLRDLVPRIA